MASVMEVYEALMDHFGPQEWWPAESTFEMLVGAILTQNVSWRNVEVALENLKNHGVLDPERMQGMEQRELEILIRPTGFYRQKAERLKALSQAVLEQGGVVSFLKQEDLRNKLLGIKGIGPETADSMILYGAGEPTFVVDAYTTRITARVFGVEADYHTIKAFFEEDLPRDPVIYGEYHALLVVLGKRHCKKSKPVCEGCPICHLCPC